MTSELNYLTIAQAAELIRTGKLSPVELTAALLKRIEALEPQVNAFITQTAGLARRQAQEAEREMVQGRYRGPLHGIPFALKDIYDTKGILTSGGSKVAIDNVLSRMRRHTRRLLESGAILLGNFRRTRVCARRTFLPAVAARARNPWNLEHFTGGLRPAVRAPLSQPGLFLRRSVPTPAVRYAALLRSAASQASCRPMAWSAVPASFRIPLRSTTAGRWRARCKTRAILLPCAIAGYDPRDRHMEQTIRIIRPS